MRLLGVVVVWLMCLSQVLGQDVHYSQFYTSNLFSNPSFAGKFDGDYRVGVNHRNQWRQISGPIVTNMFSVEKRIDYRTEAIGVGVNVINDQIGDLGLQTNKAFLTVSFEKTLGTHQLRVGMQPGMIFRNFDTEGQTFPEQWNYAQGDFDESISNGEINFNESINYFDLNLGLGWTKRVGFGKVDVAYAMNHVHKSDKNFISKEKLTFKHVIISSVDVKVKNNMSVIPYLMWMSTTDVQNILLGANINYRLNEQWKAFGGIGNRRSLGSGDSFIAMAGLGYDRFELRLSNDFTTSNLNEGGGNKSAFELSLIYTTPSTQPGKVALPCDRY